MDPLTFCWLPLAKFRHMLIRDGCRLANSLIQVLGDGEQQFMDH